MTALLQCSCRMELCLGFWTEKGQAALSTFVPAIPAETPSRGSCPPPRPAAAASTGTTPPGGERWSCTAKGKTRSLCHTETRETALTITGQALTWSLCIRCKLNLSPTINMGRVDIFYFFKTWHGTKQQSRHCLCQNTYC